MTRHAGAVLPLFSAPSTESWGIGDLPAIAPLTRWLATAGFDRLMLLPIATMEADVTSPYSAASSMAIDPIYIGLTEVPDFPPGDLDELSEAVRRDLHDAKMAPRIRYDSVRRVKHEALEIAFARFVRDEWEQLTPRAAGLAAYIARERSWLDDYAIFQALSEHYRVGSWREWPAPIRDRDPQAIDEARRQHARDMLLHQYLQWIAEGQWRDAKAAADSCGVMLFGDLQFSVDLHSADVWARADEYMLDVSLGVPPDAFSATGQDWGLPTYRWDVIAERDFFWFRQRARRMATLFSGFRVDHLVGFYRTYGRPANGAPFFSPAGEAAQTQQGETILRIFLDSGAVIIAEDLGTVPDFVRASLAGLGVPGCKVLRWERNWHSPGHPFLDPASYPPLSAALTSTHDTDTLAEWWESAPAREREASLRLRFFQQQGIIDPAAPWSHRLRDAFLELAYESGSTELMILFQDLFGWRERINVPGTVTDANWTWRLPWLVDRLDEVGEATDRARFLRTLAMRSHRAMGQ
jgi:4-alpha-glucanotransferase